MESAFIELERALFGHPPHLHRFSRPREDVLPTRVDVWDTGPELMVRVQVPGLTENDIQLTWERGVLTLEGERPAEPVEGYTVVRRERGPQGFSRSIRLPVKLDADKATALVRDGVLTVMLPKSPEIQPRNIPIQAS